MPVTTRSRTVRGLGPYGRRSVTNEQRAYDQDVARISNQWPNTRPAGASRASRPIHQRTNGCFTIPNIQALLHLPKFMNWINTHTRGNCAVAYTGVGYASRTFVPQVNDCIACAMRDLIAYYWSGANFDAAGQPLPIAANNPFLRPIFRLTRFFFGVEQDDTWDWAEVFLDCCRKSDIGPNRAVWESTYQALFEVLPVFEVTCTNPACASYEIPQNRELGYSAVPVKLRGKDRLQEGFNRYFEPQVSGPDDKLACKHCNNNLTTTKTPKIRAAPEILRVRLGIGQFSLTSMTYVKNLNPTDIQYELNLRTFQVDDSTPLKYRLTSVTPHSGASLTAGHYIVSVRGPQNMYIIDSLGPPGGMIYQVNRPTFRSNPQRFPPPPPKTGTKYQPYVLYYTRVPNTDP